MQILLADDHALFRAGLRATLLEAFGERTEVVEASDFASLGAILAEAKPLDLVLCDLRMPGMDPLRGVEDLVRLRSQIPVVVVSASEEAEDACRSIRQGARGYIPKSDSLAVLQRALELILAGGVYVPALALAAAQAPFAAAGNVGPPPDVAQDAGLPPALPALSNRQMMIFRRLADGKPNKMIARELGIAEGTVKAQLRTVFRKLGVSNRTQAALFAVEMLGSGHRIGKPPAMDEAASMEAAELREDRSASLRPGARGKLKVLNFPS